MTIDFEDISSKIFNYLREEVELEGGGTKTRLNYFIAVKNAEKGDTLLQEIPDEDNRYVLQQRQRENITLNRWIDLTMGEEVTLNSNFDAAAKTYAIQLHSLIKDDLTNNTFYRSIRMAEVLKNIMIDFFKCNRDMGFAGGEITSITMPERVNTSAGKTIESGVTYLITII